MLASTLAPAPSQTPDPAIARAEWRLAVLEELTEIGVRQARDLQTGPAANEPQADPPESPVPASRRADPVEAYANLSRYPLCDIVEQHS
jgi:hypothetical protein